MAGKIGILSTVVRELQTATGRLTFPFLASLYSLPRTGKALVDHFSLTLQSQLREYASKTFVIKFPYVCQNSYHFNITKKPNSTTLFLFSVLYHSDSVLTKIIPGHPPSPTLQIFACSQSLTSPKMAAKINVAWRC